MQEYKMIIETAPGKNEEVMVPEGTVLEDLAKKYQ